MVDKCANPACETSFRYFRGGRIFFLDPREATPFGHLRKIEHFWLCENCASGLRIVLDDAGQAHVKPLDNLCGKT